MRKRRTTRWCWCSIDLADRELYLHVYNLNYISTNNIAKYYALILRLEQAYELKALLVLVEDDSSWVIQ